MRQFHSSKIKLTHVSSLPQFKTTKSVFESVSFHLPLYSTHTHTHILPVSQAHMHSRTIPLPLSTTRAWTSPESVAGTPDILRDPSLSLSLSLSFSVCGRYSEPALHCFRSICYSKSSKREKDLLKIQQEREGLTQNPAREGMSYSKSSKRENDLLKIQQETE